MTSLPIPSDTQTRLYRPRIWPSERQPTRWDVHDAHKVPGAIFLERFRIALLHSEGVDEDALQTSELRVDASETANPVSSGDLVGF